MCARRFGGMRHMGDTSPEYRHHRLRAQRTIPGRLMSTPQRPTWSSLHTLYKRRALLSAARDCWQSLLEAGDESSASTVREIAAALKMSERNLRKQSARVMAQRLLHDLQGIPALWPKVIERYCLAELSDVMIPFLDAAGTDHDARGLIHLQADLPTTAQAAEATRACLASGLPDAALRQYLLSLSATSPRWHEILIDSLTMLSPEPAAVANDRGDAHSAAASRGGEHPSERTPEIRGLDWYRQGLSAAIDGQPLALARASCTDAGDWLLAGHMTAQAKADAGALATLLSTHKQRFARLAGQPGGAGAHLAHRLLEALADHGHPESAARLVRGQLAHLPPAWGQRLLALIDRAVARADEQCTDLLLAAASAACVPVAGTPATQIAGEVMYRQAQRLQRKHRFDAAQAGYDRLLAGAHCHDAMRLDAAINLARQPCLESVIGACHAGHATRMATDLAAAAKPLRRLAQSGNHASRAPAAYLLGLTGWLQATIDQRPANQRTARDLGAAVQASADQPAPDIWASHAVFLHLLVSLEQRTRLASAQATAALPQLERLIDRLDSPIWHRLFRAAAACDTDLARRTATILLNSPHGLPWPEGCTRALLAVSPDVCHYWQQRSLADATPLPQRFAIGVALVDCFMSMDDIEAARLALDQLETVAAEPAIAQQMLDWLDSGICLAPAWSATDTLWTRLTLARRIGNDALCAGLLPDLFFRQREVDLFAATELLDQALVWGLADAVAPLRAALASSTDAEPDDDHAPQSASARLCHGERVDIVFIGGNEIQARRDAVVNEYLAQASPGVVVAFHHVGWDGNWARRLEPLLAECERADAVVLMPYVRTHFGRAVRAGIDRPWVACPGTGAAAMQRSILKAARVALSQRKRN